jgi:hypothetical protein
MIPDMWTLVIWNARSAAAASSARRPASSPPVASCVVLKFTHAEQVLCDWKVHYVHVGIRFWLWDCIISVGCNPILLQENRVSGEAEFLGAVQSQFFEISFLVMGPYFRADAGSIFCVPPTCSKYWLDMTCGPARNLHLLKVNGPMYPYRYIIPPLPSRSKILFSL